jgi:hypothetical protein
LVAAVRAVEAQRAPPGHIEPQQVAWQEMAEPQANKPTGTELAAEFDRRRAQWEADKLAHDLAVEADKLAHDLAVETPLERRAEADRRAPHPDDDLPPPPGVPDRYMAAGKLQNGKRVGRRRKGTP